jgi:hypothetical protein
VRVTRERVSAVVAGMAARGPVRKHYGQQRLENLRGEESRRKIDREKKTCIFQERRLGQLGFSGELNMKMIMRMIIPTYAAKLYSRYT